MKLLIVVAAILGACMAEPENRGKRGLVGSLGYGYDASLGLSSLHLPLASSVVAAPSISAPIVRTHLPLTTSVLSAPAISVPTVINSVQTAPIVKSVVSQPHIVSYGSVHSLGLAPSLALNLNSLALGSSIPSVYSAGLVNSYKLGGLPITSHVSDIHAW